VGWVTGQASNRSAGPGRHRFHPAEAEISLDDDGRIQSIKRAERNFAHQIIEGFMLAVNEAVATTFTEQKRAALYRIHERPDPEKVQEFSIFARTLGLQLPEVENRPHWFARVLQLCVGSPKEYIVNNLLLRTMQQARYSPKTRPFRPFNHRLHALHLTDQTLPGSHVHRAVPDIQPKKQQPKRAGCAERRR
jgi:ribonuclease R